MVQCAKDLYLNNEFQMSRLSKLGDDNEKAQSRTKIENLEDKVSILQTKLGHCPILETDNDMFAAADIIS